MNWSSFGVAVIAGVFAVVLAPLVTARLARRNWRAQKRLELRYEVFTGATAALAAMLVDAHDLKLQSEKTEYEGRFRLVVSGVSPPMRARVDSP